MTGAGLIAAERERQVSDEGWTAKHDDEHCGKEMALAAMAYLQFYTFGLLRPLFWPWAPEWWKPKSARQNLVRAGALIAAELDRIERIEAERKLKHARGS